MYVVRGIDGDVYAYRACPKTEEIGITFPEGKNNPLKLEDTDFRDIKAGAEPFHIPSLWNYG